MGALTIIAGIVFCGVLVYAFITYLERNGKLYLPAPSFKSVGPVQKPHVPGEEKGIYFPNTYLHKAKNLFKGQVVGSESVAVSPDGFLYMLDRYGNVLRSPPNSKSSPEHVAHLGPGRPLGFHFKSNGDLFICNAGTGLQTVEKETGKVVLLSSIAPKKPGGKEKSPILYANDLSIASDGGIYFTDSTDIPPAYNALGFYDTMASYILTAVQGDHAGRLLYYNPSDGKTTCIADKFFYANGVELTPDESAVLVVETCLSKVTKIWLKGPKAGTRETFIEKLPGYPDGLTVGKKVNGEATYWISLVTLAQPLLEKMLHKRFSRWLVPRIPPSLKKILKGTAVVQVSESGRILRYMVDPKGDVVSTISAVTETDDGLFLGNLGGDCVSFLENKDYSPILN